MTTLSPGTRESPWISLCMSICMFDTGTVHGMDELIPGTRGIRDEEVAESAPLVRALLVQRLEQMWSAVEPQILGTTGKPDPRHIEAGIRIVDRLARLYRLDDPVPGQSEDDPDRIQVADMVESTLRELEARMADGTL